MDLNIKIKRHINSNTEDGGTDDIGPQQNISQEQHFYLVWLKRYQVDKIRLTYPNQSPEEKVRPVNLALVTDM